MSRALGFAALAALILTSAAAASPRESAAPRAVRSSATGAGPVVAAVHAASAATAWCGAAASSDRVPNGVAGNPVHWVYLVPVDGVDDLAAVANVMQSDAEQIDSWWRGQDATRTPRNDVTTFSCGSQLDITTVRSSFTGAQLAPISQRFAGIVQTLQRAGLTSSLTKYLVYYDGPVDDDNICGQGDSDRSDGTGFGVAVVYYRACAGVSTAAVAAHEFLHAVGAVPDQAPNACTGENSGHTCDDRSDLMFPAVGFDGLTAKALDPGRNDYYGHAGAWLDAQDSSWLVRLDGQAQLALTLSGTGTVTGDVPGLQCTASCTTTWNAGQQLNLVGTPGPGMKLVRWSGSCSGAAACALSVNAGARVTALFAPLTYRLTVAVTGQGTIRSSRPGITCRPRCSAAFASYTPVRLVAAPAKGWKLRSWSGACRGAKKTCTVPMSSAASARARFVRS